MGCCFVGEKPSRLRKRDRISDAVEGRGGLRSTCCLVQHGTVEDAELLAVDTVDMEDEDEQESVRLIPGVRCCLAV